MGGGGKLSTIYAPAKSPFLVLENMSLQHGLIEGQKFIRSLRVVPHIFDWEKVFFLQGLKGYKGAWS